MNFLYFGAELECFDAVYNTTALNERAVEIPIALAWLTDRVLADGIEIGNVLAHYSFPEHQVVDLYEVADGVTNIDVFDLEGTFEWIVSISTLEHIDDAVAALDHLQSLLSPDGSMLVTVGSGQHQALDEHLATGAGTTRCATLIRGGDGGWHQTQHLTFLPYASSTNWAESVWIGEWSR